MSKTSNKNNHKDQLFLDLKNPNKSKEISAYKTEPNVINFSVEVKKINLRKELDTLKSIIRDEELREN